MKAGNVLEWVVIGLGALWVWGYIKSALPTLTTPVNGSSYYGWPGGQSGLGLGTYGGPNGGYYGSAPWPMQGWSNQNQSWQNQGPYNFNYQTANGSQFGFTYQGM